MNDKETIKNKFIRFEPEVDDLAINQSWEKIKYFVPQKEKKRRGAIFFLYGTMMVLLVSSLVILIPSNNESSLNISAKEIAVAQKNETAPVSIITSAKKDVSGSVSKHQTKKYFLPSFANTISKQKITQHVYKKEVLNNVAEEKSNGFVTKKIEPAFIETKNNVDNAIIVYDHLPLLHAHLLIPETNKEIAFPFTPNYYLPKPTSPLSLDLFAGVQPDRISVKQSNTDQKITTNYLAGAAINYHFRNKFTFTGQFIFSKNNFNYKNTITENKIINQPISVSSTAVNYGDTVKYRHANTNYIIHANESYNFAIGADYNMFQKNKLSINAFVLLNVCATKYNYGYTRNFDKDVFVYIKGDPSPNPASNLISTTFKEGDYLKQETLINTGIMPGVLLGYHLNNKTSLIFKPACFISFSETKLVINSEAFKLKENSLLLNIGLRVNL